MSITFVKKPQPPAALSAQPSVAPWASSAPPAAWPSEAEGVTSEVAALGKGKLRRIAKPKGKALRKPGAKRAKENSSIAFPYMDLDTAITVARAFIENGGGARTRDQLAGALSQSPLSGAFIMKLSAARQFGLVDYVDGKFKLTDLGYSIVDKNESRVKSARVQAFLSVELYRKIYEEFKGKQLPPRPHGLEQTFVQMGVTQKQKSTARLAFEKSARQAGFSTLDPDRLIEPITTQVLRPTLFGDNDAFGESAVAPNPNGNSPPSSTGNGGLDPLIQGLLSRLPSPGDTWSTDKRQKWLQTLAANLEMIYPPETKDDTPSEPSQ